MELESEHKFGIFCAACVTIVITILISCITYQNLEYNKMTERMMDKGISPVVMECVDIMASRPDHKICTMVLTNRYLNGENVKTLIEGLNNE